MSNPKFTPGPWRAEKIRGTFPWIFAGQSHIAEVWGTPKMQHTNAALIAAAPKMYEMLDEILARELIAPEKAQTINDIKELLKKARGEK